jgi:hypothetical protein
MKEGVVVVLNRDSCSDDDKRLNNDIAPNTTACEEQRFRPPFSVPGICLPHHHCKTTFLPKYRNVPFSVAKSAMPWRDLGSLFGWASGCYMEFLFLVLGYCVLLPLGTKVVLKGDGGRAGVRFQSPGCETWAWALERLVPLLWLLPPIKILNCEVEILKLRWRIRSLTPLACQIYWVLSLLISLWNQVLSGWTLFLHCKEGNKIDVDGSSYRKHA